MKRLTPTLILVLAAFAALATAQAQEPTSLRLAFVDTQALIRSHPASAEIEQLGDSLESELSELQSQREELLERREAGGLSAEDEELLQALTVTIQSRQEGGVNEIREAAAPAEEAANEIIAELAQSDGYSLILDIGAAGGLVVYAGDDVPDVTERAIAMMQERFPE